jgi:hypothetical protein
MILIDVDAEVTASKAFLGYVRKIGKKVSCSDKLTNQLQ